MDSAEQMDTDNVEELEADQQMAVNELEGAEESDASSDSEDAEESKLTQQALELEKQVYVLDDFTLDSLYCTTQFSSMLVLILIIKLLKIFAAPVLAVFTENLLMILSSFSNLSVAILAHIFNLKLIM